MYKLQLTLVYFLIFTLVSSALAFKIVVSAYDSVLDYSYIPEPLKHKK